MLLAMQKAVADLHCSVTPPAGYNSHPPSLCQCQQLLSVSTSHCRLVKVEQSLPTQRHPPRAHLLGSTTPTSMHLHDNKKEGGVSMGMLSKVRSSVSCRQLCIFTPQRLLSSEERNGDPMHKGKIGRKSK